MQYQFYIKYMPKWNEIIMQITSDRPIYQTDYRLVETETLAPHVRSKLYSIWDHYQTINTCFNHLKSILF